MKLRIITGLCAAALLVALIYMGTPSLMMTVVLLFSILGYLEFDRLFFHPASLARQLRMTALTSLTILAIREDQTAGWTSLWVVFVFLCSWHLITWNKMGDFQRGVRELSLECLGYIYVVGLFGFILPIVEISSNGRDYLLLLFIVVFAGDTAAYFVGTHFGKHPLALNLSPKKTVEGAFAAVAISVAASAFWLFFIYKNQVESDFALKILLFAPVGSALGQMGDLLESLFKRSQSQKDSGYFLPGHGGVLDRIDGLALIAPIYYIFLTRFLE